MWGGMVRCCISFGFLAPDSARHASPQLNRRNFESLEVLRGLAALHVVLKHARGFFWVVGERMQSRTHMVAPCVTEPCA